MSSTGFYPIQAILYQIGELNGADSLAGKWLVGSLVACSSYLFQSRTVFLGGGTRIGGFSADSSYLYAFHK